MGITIHFEGRLKAPAAYPLLIDELRDYATVHNWPCEAISEDQTTLMRVRDEQAWDYTGPTRGLQLSPDPNAEPLRFEFDQDYYIQEFIKTQFAGIETHIAIVTLFRRVQPFFEKLTIDDEGEFWETSDATLLTQHLQNCQQALQALLAKHPNARGPVRLPSGRIADYMS